MGKREKIATLRQMAEFLSKRKSLSFKTCPHGNVWFQNVCGTVRKSFGEENKSYLNKYN
jgi:hypothetical protein